MEPIHILLVGDIEGDDLLLTNGLQRAGTVKNISTANKGKKYIRFQGKLHPCEGRSLSALPLVNDSLPRNKGLNVLNYIKKHDEPKQMQVNRLANYTEIADIRATNKNYANCNSIKLSEGKIFSKNSTQERRLPALAYKRFSAVVRRNR